MRSLHDIAADIEQRLAEAEAQEAAATEGEWTWCSGHLRPVSAVCKCRQIFGADGKAFVARCFQLTDWPNDPDPTPDRESADANVRLIAAMRNRERRRLAADRETLRLWREAEGATPSVIDPLTYSPRRAALLRLAQVWGVEVEG